MASVADDESTRSADTQGELECIVPRARQSLTLDSHDQQLVQAGSSLDRDLGQISLASTLQKADAMFQSIMDPRNEDTKKMVSELLHEPMAVIYSKFREAVMTMDVKDAAAARESMEVAREVLKLSAVAREAALEHVYKNMERQVESFSTSVEVYNEKMKETVVQALDLYRQRIDTAVEIRKKVLEQKRTEYAFQLEAHMQHTEIEAACDRMKMAVQEERHGLEDARALRAQQREEQRAAAELEKQRKRDELQHLKAERELERDRKRDEAEHDKALKKLEALAKKGQIGREERDGVVRELATEMARYNAEFGLAQEAMRTAIRSNRTCQIDHVAPRIDWGTPPDVPPRVVPGHVSWKLQ